MKLENKMKKNIQDKYKMKFHNLFVKHFLSLTGGYDIEKDYECMNRLIYGGSKIDQQQIRFVLLTQREYFIQLWNMLKLYWGFDMSNINQSNGIGVVLSFSFSNISQLKIHKSDNPFQKQLKQLIINCCRDIKKSIGE